MIIDILRGQLLSIFFFQRCKLCDQPLPFHQPFVCQKCHLLINSFDIPLVNYEQCTYLNSAFILFPYAAGISAAITQFKYNQDFSALNYLNQMIKNRLTEISLPDISLMIPVPIYPAKERKRGFNQSHYYANTIQRIIKRPLWKGSLTKIMDTPPQVNLCRHLRQKNLLGAFAWEDRRSIHDKRILLIDDVFTTGSTGNECAFILKKQGAAQVHILALAAHLQED